MTGPWSEPIAAFAQLPGYAATLHADLLGRRGRDLVVSYFHPIGPLTGEIRLTKVTVERQE